MLVGPRMLMSYSSLVNHYGQFSCGLKTGYRLACIPVLYILYHILCSCGKVYIGEAVRRLEMRIKEHMGA